MRKKTFVIFWIFIAIFFFFSENSWAFTFTKTLKLGDTDSAVWELQKILNSDPRTVIALYGPGSKGNETSYFGQLTAKAVSLFQELHFASILAPSGLLKGTGFVGMKTIAELNKIGVSVKNSISNDQKPKDTQLISRFSVNTKQLSNFPILKDTMVYYPSAYEVSRGQNVTLTGVGFASKDNLIYFGDKYVLSGVDSSDNQSLSFLVPNEIPFGKYDISLGRDGGISSFGTFFVVTDKNSKRPVVSGVSPSSGEYGSFVTINGSNFTPTGNEIRTSYKIIKNLPSSDGKTISFNVSPDGFQSGDRKSFSWPISMWVVNDGGVSKNSAVFTLEVK